MGEKSKEWRARIKFSDGTNGGGKQKSMAFDIEECVKKNEFELKVGSGRKQNRVGVRMIPRKNPIPSQGAL